MRSVELASPTDFAGFRDAARVLLAHRVPPEGVSFQLRGESQSLFVAEAVEPSDGSGSDTFKVPRSFVELAHKVSLHRDPQRFALLYRLLWRLREEPRLLSVTVDEDVALARARRKSVERDLHKMHAYVRFREAKGVEPRAYIAWFEPAHYIVEEAAPFFVRRFSNVCWTILTPDQSASWNGHALRFGPGGRRADAPAEDATEDLWRTYYRSIFNPARLKVHAMLSHMPKKYWRNLPESVAIADLIRAAAPRESAMIEAPATDPARYHRGASRQATKGAWRQHAAELPKPSLAPSSIAALAADAQRCRGCDLWRTATQTVFGQGPDDARVFFVGEQPGDQEDLSGTPFVGPAGRLLDRALRDAGIERSGVYVTNAVKHFKYEPRGKRRLHKKPAQQEIVACRSWLARELAVIRPKLVVALGATAARSLIGRDVPIHATRGRILDKSGALDASLLITVHPSYLLRLPKEQQDAAYRAFVADLALVRQFVAEGPSTRR